MKSEITPLDQVDSRIVIIHLPLPVNVRNKIGLDLPGLEKICKLMGIVRLSISNLSNHPIITSTNISGTATGSLTNTAISENSYEPNKIDIKCHRAMPANIQIDMQQILFTYESAEEIARQISTELRISLLKIGAKTMLVDHNEMDIKHFMARVAMTMFLYGIDLMIKTLHETTNQSPPTAYLVREICIALGINIASKRRANIYDLPFLPSLFTGYGIELDRFLILLFQLATNRLIKAATCP